MARTRVLIVDNHAAVRREIQTGLRTTPAVQLVGEVESVREALDRVDGRQPDVIFMDLTVPCPGDFEKIARIKRDHPHVKVLVLTNVEDRSRVNAAMAAGVDGYLLLEISREILLEAIKATQRGEMPLHPRIARQLFGASIANDDFQDPTLGRLDCG